MMVSASLLAARPEDPLPDSRTIYDQRLKELEDAVLKSAGSTTPGIRRSVADRAGRRERAATTDDDLPAWATDLVDAVVAAPTQADVAGALASGRTEDEIFEVIAAASLGVAVTRAEAGLAALGRKRP